MSYFKKLSTLEVVLIALVIVGGIDYYSLVTNSYRSSALLNEQLATCQKDKNKIREEYAHLFGF